MEKQDFLQIIKSYCVTAENDNSRFLYWYPLNNVSADIPMVAYDLDAIYRANKIALLENVLKACAIDVVVSVQNQDFKLEPETINLRARLYEKEADGYNFPWYVENYYYDETKSWMIYVSHEATITFTGKKVVEIAKAVIDDKYLV